MWIDSDKGGDAMNLHASQCPLEGLFRFDLVQPIFADQTLIGPFNKIWNDTKKALLDVIILVRQAMDLDRVKNKIQIMKDAAKAMRRLNPTYSSKLDKDIKDLANKYEIPV